MESEFQAKITEEFETMIATVVSQANPEGK